MRKLLAIAALFACASSHAAPITSDASGVYLGADRVCRIVMSRFQTLWIQADVACIGFDGAYTLSLTTLYAPGICWSSGVAINLRPWAPNEYLALRSYDADAKTLQIIRGTDQTAVINGIGINETWARIGYVPSPIPYSCGSGPQQSNKPKG